MKSITKNIPNESDFINLFELCNLLQPFIDLTEIFSVSKYVSIKQYLIELYDRHLANWNKSHEQTSHQVNIRQTNPSGNSNTDISSKRKKNIFSSIYEYQVLTESVSSISSIEIEI